MRRLALACVGVAVAGCGGDGDDRMASSAAPPLPWSAAALEPLPEPAPAEADLGRLLFYDPILSDDRRTACATCHSEIWGMSDGLPRSIGVGGEGPTGPGRSGAEPLARNAQTLWNVAYRESLFWDGRTQGLEAQALEPLRAEDELARDPTLVAADLAALPGYAERFTAAYPGRGARPETIALALAAFQRTLVTRRAPYDRYVAGDEGALSDRARRGMFAFAELGCSGCHVPPRFESERYAARVPHGDDRGRYIVSEDPADEGRFRVPTLRNVRETAPYFHDGRTASLEDAVRAELEASFDAGELPRAPTEADVAELTEFVSKGLTDISGEPDRPEVVPSGLEVPPDGFRIPR